MVEKKKSGRPPTPLSLKRKVYPLRLPQWIIDWIGTQSKSGSELIEEALCKQHKLKPPK